MSEMLELAKRIAERAGKNAKVAPELLYAPILWELQDDARSSADSAAALRLLAAEDERQSKLHELLETIREQIRLEVAPEHRPEGLFKNIQDAVYAMRGRTRLMDDAAITHVLTEPQSARTESHSPAAMEGEKDTIVNLIHEHVGFEVLLAIESGVLTGVEKAAEAILAELGRRSQAVNAPSLNVKSICESTKDRRCIEVWLAEPVTAADRDALTAAMTRPQCGGK